MWVRQSTGRISILRGCWERGGDFFRGVAVFVKKKLSKI